MNVKNKLKISNITLRELSEKLQISRPTLNNYINIYDKKRQLPKEKYQTIFDKLFSPQKIDKKVFNEQLNKFNRSLNRKKDAEVLNDNYKKTDLINSIMSKMETDFKSKDFNEEIYIFINILITNYRKQIFWNNFSNYALYLNGLLDIKNINNEQKVFVSNMCKFTADVAGNKLKINEEYYKEFLNKIDVIKNKKINDRRIFKEIISNKLNKIISNKLKLGNSIEDIDTNLLLKK